jgi:hypothetical protein
MQSEKLPYAFLKEEIEKQERRSNFLHYESFRANIKRVPIASKFWSKYDSKVDSKDEKKHQDYLQQIEKSITEIPKDKYNEPIVESHVYGWKTAFLNYDARDTELLFHPRYNSDITRVGEKIASEKNTERQKYTGVPFKLT